MTTSQHSRPNDDDRDSITTKNEKPHYSLSYWPALAIGGAMMAFGLRGLLRTGPEVDHIGFARVFVGAALVHDLIVAPVAIAVGVVVSRAVPRSIRPFVQAGLIISGCVALFAFPFVRGYGRQADNPTILPRNYGAGLAIVLTAVWVGTAITAIGVRWRQRSKSAS